MKITLSSAALALCGALALSACQSGTPAASGSGQAPGGAASTTATGAVSPSTSAASAGGSTGSSSSTASAASPTSADSAPSAAPTSARSTASAGSTASKPSTGAPSGADNDAQYAFKHSCTSAQITLQLTRMTDVPTRRLITVRDNATTSCGLSYYPLVDLGDAQSADSSKNLKPLIPGGLGGPPAFVLYAGKTAYAVLDLNPGGSGSGQATKLTEIDVLASATMPNADTKNFPLGGGSVGTPKLGLYEDKVADAVASMQGANTKQE